MNMLLLNIPEIILLVNCSYLIPVTFSILYETMPFIDFLVKTMVKKHTWTVYLNCLNY